ncbi:hypothetical protein [Amycolatopsis ultiminotia]|uniref:hypothetical protein n=1 Tax=Amycolatopsis ultiminotia TaxID=543629 RepID=UPI0031EF0603
MPFVDVELARPALTEVERALVDHVERGAVLDLAEDETIDRTEMRSWDTSRAVRAAVVRDILRGRLAPEPDPHGLRLRGARITGRLDLENLTSTVALELRDCLLSDGLIARDAHLPTLDLTGSVLEHPHAAPMAATRLTTTALFLDQVVVEGHSASGAVDISDARLGALQCCGAKLCNDSGPAVDAERMQADQSVFLRDGFEAVGTGKQGTVRLHSARIGGQLSCQGAKLRNDSGPALHAERLQVGENVFLRDGFEAIGAGAVTVTLSGARIDGLLVFQPARLEHLTNPSARLNVDGLVYSEVPAGLTTDDWLRLLRGGTPFYAAQPYQQLAAAHRAAGHDDQARRVLLAQRRDQVLRRAITSRAERAWVRFTGLTLGYGYQPWRALIGLVAAIAVSVVLACALGGHGGLTQVRNPPAPGPAPCTLVERIGIGLEVGTPLITPGTRTHCDTTDGATGQILTATGWALRFGAWAFATLFIAGFTSAVRKT